MKIRGFTLAVLLTVAAPSVIVLLFAPSAWAQGASDLEVSGDATSAGTAQGGADAPSSDPETPAEYDDDTPPPGTEVRVIVAGESEAAAAYAQGDSVTGFNASDMEAMGALSIADVAGFTPNLEIVTTGSTTPTFFIRGVGLNDFSSNSSSPVAIFQDDIAINAPAMQLGTIFDMENIAIFRGPVGTGAARNASAGAIKLYSRKPTGTYNGFLRSSFGNYNYNDFEGAVEAPIYEDILLARIAFRSSQRDGYQKNACGGQLPNAFRTQRTSTAVPNRNATLCGEQVEAARPGGPDGFSPIEPFLPTRVNDLGNWASRITLRFQPTLDQDWLFNGHVAKRDEFTRQGLSYGIKGRQTFPDGSRIDGRLGGQDRTAGLPGFQRPEVQAMTRQLRDVLAAPAISACGGLSGCTRPELRRARRTALDAAQIAVANDIGANLDIDPYNGYYNTVGKTKNLTYGGYLRGEIALPHDLLLTTNSGFDAYDRFLESDTDQSPNTLFEITTDDEGWQFYQNLEIGGAFDRYLIDWTVGGFYLQERLDVLIDNDLGNLNGTGVVTNREYTQKTWSFGIYADMEWRFWDDFILDGGIRYNWDKKDMDYLLKTTKLSPVRDDQTRSAPTGEIRLTYNFRDDTHVYWKYTRGWKAGQYNATSSLVQGVSYAEPENNNAYETGLRASWFDTRVNADISMFLYDYSDYQLFTVQNDFSSSTPEFVVINASDVQVYGAEFTVNTRPWDNSRFEARFSWLESTFVDFVQSQVTQEIINNQLVTQEIGLNFSGNRLLNSPRFKISLTAEHTLELGRYGSLTARYDVVWTDTTYFDPTEGRGLVNKDRLTFLPEDTIGQKAFWLHNMIFIYRPPVGNISVEAFVRNLTDQVYKSFAFDASQFQSTSIYFTGEPRMFGATIGVNF